MKRLLDLALVVVTMPFWLSAMALVAMAILLFSGSPVMYRSMRAGLDGKPFGFLKFRTMRDGEGDDSERITRIGSILRKTSLDELPQLFHVLSGKMSLVGPRPLPVKYLPRYSNEQMRRHEVRPGITGWAQVNGRNAISWDEKFALDVWYVDHRTLALDFKIILKTVLNVFISKDINHSASMTMPEFTGGIDK